MHIILGALGTIVTILWLLHRLAQMGIDLGGLNPFLWRRRTKWKKHHDANPIYKITSPLEATGLLVTAVAKIDGDMSSEEKIEILKMFSEEFHLSTDEATGLLVSSSHILGKGDDVKDHLKKVLAPSLANFTEEQAVSSIELIERISKVSHDRSELKERLIENIKKELTTVTSEKSKWS